MTVHGADNLRAYRDPEASVVVLEYEVHGESVQTGRPYDNCFVSIITVKELPGTDNVTGPSWRSPFSTTTRAR